MIKSSVKIDEAAIARKIEAAKTSILEEVKNEFAAIARDAVRFSPVDTGAFVTSWSFETGKSGRPRGKSSLNRPKAPNEEDMRKEGEQNLLSDIDKIPDLESTKVAVLRNGAPHAEYVDYGDSKDRGRVIKGKLIRLHG
jgi:hypothetical protein